MLGIGNFKSFCYWVFVDTGKLGFVSWVDRWASYNNGSMDAVSI